jgi:aminoglycoside phosphotransferase (APT) family kinase protein
MKSSEAMLAIILDHGMAQLGDSFVNFVYSLALTRRFGRPVGKKISDKDLAEAARKAELRALLPSRTNRGDVANSVEALLVYMWLNHLMTIDEMVEVISLHDETPLGFAKVVQTALEKLRNT